MDVLDTISNRNVLIKGEVDLMVSCYKGDNLDVIAALGDKIMHMCLNIGCPSSVKPMLKSIINGKIKMWSIGNHYYNKDEFTHKGHQLHGYATGRVHRTLTKEDYVQGHFRWNHMGYMLHRSDRDFLNDFFFKSIRVESPNIGGITARHMVTNKVSDNLTRMAISTPKGNEYAIYYYKDSDTMFGNWKTEHFEGEEKAEILKLMEKTLR